MSDPCRNDRKAVVLGQVLVGRIQIWLVAVRGDHRRAQDALAEHRFKIAAAEARQTELDQQRVVLEAELRVAVVQEERVDKIRVRCIVSFLR